MDDPLSDEGEAGSDANVEANALLCELPSALDRGPVAALRRRVVEQRLFRERAEAVCIGRFTVQRQIGGGAMGAVYEARDEVLERTVAIKLLRAESSGAESRLKHEARALACLSHPNVVTVFEIGDHQGHVFLAMEYVRGRTLEDWLRAHMPSWREIVAVYAQAGLGLAAAHAAGIVHGDFKPANAMVGEDARVRVVDFGLALRAHSNGEATSARAGTPGYIAPERYRGREADDRSDQYSFAVALNGALVGSTGHPPGPADCPARLLEVVRRGMAEDPQDRWPSMETFLAELERETRGALHPPRKPTPLAAFGLAAIGAAAAAIALAGSGVLSPELFPSADQLRDRRLVNAAQRFSSWDPAAAAAALLEVEDPRHTPGWRAAASAALQEVPTVARLPSPYRVTKWTTFVADGRLLSHIPGQGLISWTGGGVPAPAPILAERTLINLPRVDAGRRRGLLAGRGVWWLVYFDGSRPARSLDLEDARIASAAFDAQDRALAISTDGRILRWSEDLAEPQLVGRLPPHDPRSAPWRFTLTPHGGFAVASSTTAGSTHVYPLPLGGGAPVRGLENFRAQNYAFSRDESAFALWDGTDTFWVFDRRAAPRTYRNPEGAIHVIALSPDGSRLITGTRSGPARVWNVGEEDAPSQPLPGQRGIAWVEFSPDGVRAVTASHDHTVRVWDLVNSRFLMLKGHFESVNHATFTRDGRRVATSAVDGARVFDLSAAGSYTFFGHEERIWSASLSPDQKRLVTAGFDGTARLWPLDQASPPVILRGHQGRDIYTAVFSPDGHTVATGGNDGTARWWEVATGREKRVFTGHSIWAYGLAFNPDGRSLVTGDKAGTLRTWPLDQESEPRILEPACPNVVRRLDAVAFSPQGSLVAAQACGCAGSTCIFRGDSFALVARLDESTFFDARDVAFVDDERLLIPASDGTLHLWSTAQHKTTRIYTGHAGRSLAVAVSDDGSRLVSGGADGTVRVFDVDRSEPIAVLRGHEDWVADVHFDHSGRRVVTASYDGTARVHDLDRPEEVIVLRGHTGKLRYAAFAAPAGAAGPARIVTASFDGTARVWSVDPDEPLDVLRTRLLALRPQPLSPAQRAQFLDEAH